MKRISFGISFLLLLITSGCAVQALKDQQVQLCSRLASVDTAIQRFREVEKSPNVDGLKQAEAQLTEALNQVRSTANEVPEAETQNSVETLDASYKDLKTTVQQTPNQSSTQSGNQPGNQSRVAQGMKQISDRVTRVEAAVNNMQSRLQCPDASPTPTPTVQ